MFVKVRSSNSREFILFFFFSIYITIVLQKKNIYIKTENVGQHSQLAEQGIIPLEMLQKLSSLKCKF